MTWFTRIKTPVNYQAIQIKNAPKAAKKAIKALDKAGIDHIDWVTKFPEPEPTTKFGYPNFKNNAAFNKTINMLHEAGTSSHAKPI